MASWSHLVSRCKVTSMIESQLPLAYPINFVPRWCSLYYIVKLRQSLNILAMLNGYQRVATLNSSGLLNNSNLKYFLNNSTS